MNTDQIGEFLEHQGLSDEQIDAYFEHHGVKGQKWGVRKAEARAAKGPDRFGNRNNAKAQRRVDQVKRVAQGKASLADKVNVALFKVPLQDLISEGSLSGASQATLDRGARIQRKVNLGKKNVTDILNRLGGVDIRELSFD